LSWFYRSYFRVETTGVEHIPKTGRVLLVGNHAGGVAIDAAMVSTSLVLDMEPPRLCHGMADKFLSKIPFLNEWMQHSGMMTGVPEHAIRILESERPLLVFPEGHHGTAKLYKDRNTLVDFGTGFMRMALATKSPIVPFAFLGAGDALPTIANLERIGRLFGVPYIPVTAYLVPFPRPAKMSIRYGKPLKFQGRGDEDDLIVQRKVDQVKEAIAALLREGLDEQKAERAS
jgi:1-acyl-sn-glycerol-3-phosphate acyltransferase